MLANAKAQLLALLFNVASERAYEYDVVMPYLVSKLKSKYPLLGLSDYPLTVGQAIDTSCRSIVSLSSLEFARDVCKTLNDGYNAIILKYP
jgi:hypothetical protein